MGVKTFRAKLRAQSRFFNAHLLAGLLLLLHLVLQDDDVPLPELVAGGGVAVVDLAVLLQRVRSLLGPAAAGGRRFPAGVSDHPRRRRRGRGRGGGG